MPDLTKEGKQYIVMSKREGNTFMMSFTSWQAVENYIAFEPGVYKIVSMECYDIPLTGLRLAVP